MEKGGLSPPNQETRGSIRMSAWWFSLLIWREQAALLSSQAEP